MPLPVSSQTYMPNPLLYAQASQMGLDYGQDIVSGAIDSAQGVANVASTIQDIGMKPEKLKLEQRKADQDDRRIGLEEQQVGFEGRRTSVAEDAEERMLAQQGIDKGIKEQQLDIQRDRLKRVGLSQGIAAQKQADKETFDALTSDFILDRNVTGLMGELGDVSSASGRRRQAKFLTQLVKDKEVAQGFVNTAEDALANDNLNVDQRKFLEDQVKVLTMHSKVQAQSELAEIGATVLRSNLGVNVEKGEELDARHDPVTNAIHVQGQKKGSKDWIALGSYAPGTEKERNALMSGISAINRLNQIERENREQISKSVEAVSAKEDKTLRIPGAGRDAQERPTKLPPTPVSKVGLSRRPLTADDERRAIEETRSQMRQKPLTKEQLKAKAKAKSVGGTRSVVMNSPFSQE